MPDLINKFLYIESAQIPLTEIPFEQLKQTIIDPTTGTPYKGIVLEGIFAVLKQDPNNNKRLYSIPEYLYLLQILKKQIFSSKGVYGELEHPKSYAVNYNNASHKILDVWYNEEEQTVYGRIILLDTEKGKIAQEIIRSGGQLAVSARAAGEENENPNGTFTAVTKLLTTFDLVYHPGFSQAVLNFKCLNESQKIWQESSVQKTGFSTLIYEKDLGKLDGLYNKYINLNESSKCFLEWYSLNESETSAEKTKQKSDEKVLEDNEANDKKQLENKLEIATEEDLSENIKQRAFFEEVTIAQKQLRKKQGKSIYDNSAGFIKSQTVTDNAIVN